MDYIYHCNHSNQCLVTMALRDGQCKNYKIPLHSVWWGYSSRNRRSTSSNQRIKYCLCCLATVIHPGVLSQTSTGVSISLPQVWHSHQPRCQSNDNDGSQDGLCHGGVSLAIHRLIPQFSYTRGEGHSHPQVGSFGVPSLRRVFSNLNSL